MVTVTAVNEPPTANDGRTNEDTTVVMDVLANDADPDGDRIRVETLSTRMHVVARGLEGGVAYTPEKNYHGADRFTCIVLDEKGLTATALVDVAPGHQGRCCPSVRGPARDGNLAGTSAMPARRGPAISQERNGSLAGSGRSLGRRSDMSRH